MKLPSYKQADCCVNCDCDCDYLNWYDNEPCWGQVTVVDEIYSDDDSWWIHACEGHAERNDGGKYIESQNSEDKI